MEVKRLTRGALLTAVALTIFMIELQIPAPAPIPGIKLGLANIITVYAMFTLGPSDAFAILLARIFLGNLFSGQLISMIYSLSGGLACFLVMLLLRKLLTPRQIWVCSVFGAAAHNCGQIAAAIFFTGTPALLCYLPVLLVSGIAAGLFTGFCAQFVVARFSGIAGGGAGRGR